MPHPTVEVLFKEAKRRRLTGVKWAQQAKLDRKTLYSIKHQGKNPGIDTVTKMAKGLGLKIVFSPL